MNQKSNWDSPSMLAAALQASSLAQQLQERERQLADVKQRYHRASLDNADLADTFTKLKQELQQAK
jgi:hypothetical protein